MDTLNRINIKSLVVALSQLPSALPRDKQAQLNYLGRAIALDVSQSQYLTDFALSYEPIAKLYQDLVNQFTLNLSNSNFNPDISVLPQQQSLLNLTNVIQFFNNADDEEIVNLIPQVFQACDSVKSAQIELELLLNK